MVERFREACGPADPEVARALYPDSIRALLGVQQVMIHDTALVVLGTCDERSIIGKNCRGSTKKKKGRDDDGERAPRPPWSVAPYVARIRSKPSHKRKVDSTSYNTAFATGKVPVRPYTLAGVDLARLRYWYSDQAQVPPLSSPLEINHAA